MKKVRSKEPKQKRTLAGKIWRIVKKVLIYGFLFSILYVLFCKWINPPITVTQIVSWVSGHGLKRQYVSLEDMSPNIKLAVMSGEDQLFPDHNGFDFKSIKKAMKHNQKSRSLHGASTISQQVAKNVFLWQHGGYFRKGLEVYFTFLIEHVWSKKRILELYLNVAETGDGVFGVEAAAKKYFNKSSKYLTRREAAMIAACLPNPVEYTVKPLSSHVAARTEWILRQMNNLEGDPDVQELIQPSKSP